MNSQQITLQILKDIKQKISPNMIKKAVESAAQETINIIRNRTMRGIDVNGKRMPAKKFHYELKNKTGKVVKKIPSYFMQKSNSKGLRSLIDGKTTTEWVATKSPSHGRLTGALFSGMKYLITQNGDFGTKISGSFKIYVESSQANKLEWLKSTSGATKWNGVANNTFFSTKNNRKKTYSKPSRNIWGLSTNPALRNKEIRQIETAFLKELKYISNKTDVKIK